MRWKVQDHYFKKAKKENYLARSVYKLEEMDKKFDLIRPGERILDLGHFPGSWTQYAHTKVGGSGLVVGIDTQVEDSLRYRLKGVKLFKKSIFDMKNLQDLEEETPFDTVMSDMAPKTTGIKSLDQDRSLCLTESAFAILPSFLREGGSFIIKVFDSHQSQLFLKGQKNKFFDFRFYRPRSTRSTSKELFVIARGHSPDKYLLA